MRNRASLRVGTLTRKGTSTSTVFFSSPPTHPHTTTAHSVDLTVKHRLTLSESLRQHHLHSLQPDKRYVSLPSIGVRVCSGRVCVTCDGWLAAASLSPSYCAWNVHGLCGTGVVETTCIAVLHTMIKYIFQNIHFIYLFPFFSSFFPYIKCS